MSDTSIFNDNSGLVQTTVHGFKQDVFLVSQDKIESFNNYSFDLQIWIALFSVFFGSCLSSGITWASIQTDNILVKIIFWASLSLTVLSIVFLIKSWFKFKSVKNNIFIKIEQNGNNLKILEAKYGIDNNFVDIKNRLIEKIESNKLKIKITNDLVDADPAKGIPKKAKIRYIFNNEVKDIVVNENNYLELP